MRENPSLHAYFIERTRCDAKTEKPGQIPRVLWLLFPTGPWAIVNFSTPYQEAHSVVKGD